MKKFVISSNDLKPAIKKLGLAINEKSVLPVTKNILCKVGAGGDVEMIATDLEITISYKLTAQLVEGAPYELMLPFDFLAKVLTVVKNEPILIEHPSARKARLVCSEDKYELNSLDKFEDYPKVPSIPKKNVLQLDADFNELLNLALLTVDKNELRPAMQRVLLDIQKDASWLASTDAHFMFRHKVNIVNSEPEQIQFSAKMVKALEGVEAADLCWSEKQVVIKNDKITVLCRRYDEKYPNYATVIPSYGPNLLLEKVVLQDVLHKACLNGTKQTNLYLKKDTAAIFFETDDLDLARKISNKVPAEYTGNVEVIAFNARKMLTILDQVRTVKVNLHIHDSTKAILFTSEENPDYTGLLMPLILNK